MQSTNTSSRTRSDTFFGASRKRPADPDLAAQVVMLRSAISRHNSQLNRLLANTCSNYETIGPGECKLFDMATLDLRLASLKNSPDRALEGELKKAKTLGAVRKLATPPAASDIDQMSRSFPHFAAVIELVRQRAALAEITPGRIFTLPPILLSGSPGVGKTAFCEALARCLGVPTRRVDLATTTAGFLLSGSHSSWSSARPGAVWSLLQSPFACGLLLLDELDKACSGNYPPIGPLYGLLERSSATHFADEYIEVEIDASHVMAFATCNDIEQVEGALRSRFAEFEIPEPTPSQMIDIARSVYRARHRQSAWGSVFPDELESEVAERLTVCTPREVAGLLEAAVAHAASKMRRQIEPADIEYAQMARQQRSPQQRHIGFI